MMIVYGAIFTILAFVLSTAIFQIISLRKKKPTKKTTGMKLGLLVAGVLAVIYLIANWSLLLF